MRFIGLCSGFQEKQSDDRFSSAEELENGDEGAAARSNVSDGRNRVPSKVVEDQIRRLLEKSRKQTETEAIDSARSALEAPDQRSEISSNQKQLVAIKKKASRRRSVDEEDQYDRLVDEEAYADNRRADRVKDSQMDSRARRPHRRAADRGEEDEEDGEEERPIPEKIPKRIDRATIGRLVKNKSFTKQFKRWSKEQNEVLNDAKVQNALKKIRNFAEKEKTASLKRKRTSRRVANKQADSAEEQANDGRPSARSGPKRKKSSRSYRVSEEAKASKSVIFQTKKFEELNRGLKKILTTRKKGS